MNAATNQQLKYRCKAAGHVTKCKPARENNSRQAHVTDPARARPRGTLTTYPTRWIEHYHTTHRSRSVSRRNKRPCRPCPDDRPRSETAHTMHAPIRHCVRACACIPTNLRHRPAGSSSFLRDTYRTGEHMTHVRPLPLAGIGRCMRPHVTLYSSPRQACTYAAVRVSAYRWVRTHMKPGRTAWTARSSRYIRST